VGRFMLIQRPFWQNMIEKFWGQRNIIWLMGIRRAGKTSLCLSLPDIEYFDCERPRVRELLNDPEGFLETRKGKRIVLDEVHRLDNPSEILKLAADHYPDVKIIATGSSTLGASAKFKDTLAGRKREIWLTPLLLHEMAIFGNSDLRHRFLFGGLPSFFRQMQLPEIDYRDWIDSYWAKDIQELFKVGKRNSFQKFEELLLVKSGGMFEATKFTGSCEVSRPTIGNYLDVLEETFVVHVVRPFSTHKATEIVMAPKVYGFDTGFICYAQGRTELRPEDLGFMWEHCVLNEIQGTLQTRSINYWRDKRGHEVDFVIKDKRDHALTAIECKFSITKAGKEALDAIAENFAALRNYYPHGENFVVAHDVDFPFQRHYGDMVLTFVNAQELVRRLQKEQ
jgi:uncharacterized protein